MTFGRLPLSWTAPGDGDSKIVAAAGLPTSEPVLCRTVTVTADFAQLRLDLERELDCVLGGTRFVRSAGRLPR